MEQKIQKIPADVKQQDARRVLEATQGVFDPVETIVVIAKFVTPEWGPLPGLNDTPPKP